MKNTFSTLLTLCLVLVSLNSWAGDDDKPDTRGIRAGWNSATFTNDLGDLGTSQASFYVGAFKEFKIVPMLRFSSGLEYSQSVSSISSANAVILAASSPENFSVTDDQINLGYLTVPLSLRVKLGPFRAYAGASGSYRITGTVGEDKVKLTDKSYVNRFDANAQFGASFNIIMIMVEARYNLGLVDAFNGYKNNYFQLGLGLNF